MKKILFIIPSVPYPLTSGGNQAFFNMVDYIRHKMSVSVLFYAWTKEEEAQVEALKILWSNVDFHVFAKEKETRDEPFVRNLLYYKWLKKLKTSIERKMKRQISPHQQANDENLRHGRIILHDSVFRELDEEFVDYVSGIANLGFDIIQVEFYGLIALGYILPQDVETIFVHHELRYIRNENELSLIKEVVPDDLMHFFVAKDFEWNALRKYKHVIALTEIDKRLLTEFIKDKCSVYSSPAVVHFDANSHVDFTPCTSNRFTFVGHGGHFPNLDALFWFCKEVAPFLRKNRIKFSFQVAGIGYERYVKELKKLCPEIELVGFVKELKTFLQGSIALVPIRIGSGMRMKILEVVSLNIPFITTSKGMEGFSFNHGEECFIADEANDFANSMISLAADSQLQKKLVLQAKLTLKALYNPQEMLDRRLSVYNSILKENI